MRIRNIEYYRLMHMIILSLHILVASILTVSSLVVTVSARQRQTTNAYLVMMVTFGATIVSGLSLLLVGASLGRVCATMTALTLAVLLVRRYYLVRTTVPAL